MEMQKLEKIEFGGSRGNGLSQHVAAIRLEFEETWKIFKDSTYDSLDPTSQVYIGFVVLANAVLPTSKDSGSHEFRFQLCSTVHLRNGTCNFPAIL